MLSAYVLTGALANTAGRHEEAFGKYEAFLRTYIDAEQKGTERFAAVFAPKTRWGLCLRNQVIRVFAIPGLAKVAIGRNITDSMRLP